MEHKLVFFQAIGRESLTPASLPAILVELLGVTLLIILLGILMNLLPSWWAGRAWFGTKECYGVHVRRKSHKPFISAKDGNPEKPSAVDDGNVLLKRTQAPRPDQKSKTTATVRPSSINTDTREFVSDSGAPFNDSITRDPLNNEQLPCYASPTPAFVCKDKTGAKPQAHTNPGPVKNGDSIKRQVGLLYTSTNEKGNRIHDDSDLLVKGEAENFINCKLSIDNILDQFFEEQQLLDEAIIDAA